MTSNLNGCRLLNSVKIIKLQKVLFVKVFFVFLIVCIDGHNVVVVVVVVMLFYYCENNNLVVALVTEKINNVQNEDQL